jgi:hypothetical protein
MKKLSSAEKLVAKELNAQLAKLQAELLLVQKTAGLDEYIVVKRQDNQSRFERIRIKDQADKAVGHYLMMIEVTAKQKTVVMPLSIASGKKPTGFVYQIEGTGEGSLSTAQVSCHGEGITQITLGTIVYVKIPPLKTATFRIQIEIRGKLGKVYKLVIHRINYKLRVTDARYKQYVKEISSKSLKFS